MQVPGHCPAGRIRWCTASAIKTAGWKAALQELAAYVSAAYDFATDFPCTNSRHLLLRRR